jgi:hypothetical protein
MPTARRGHASQFHAHAISVGTAPRGSCRGDAWSCPAVPARSSSRFIRRSDGGSGGSKQFGDAASMLFQGFDPPRQTNLSSAGKLIRLLGGPALRPIPGCVDHSLFFHRLQETVDARHIRLLAAEHRHLPDLFGKSIAVERSLGEHHENCRLDQLIERAPLASALAGLDDWQSSDIRHRPIVPEDSVVCPVQAVKLLERKCAPLNRLACHWLRRCFGELLLMPSHYRGGRHTECACYLAYRSITIRP